MKYVSIIIALLFCLQKQHFHAQKLETVGVHLGIGTQPSIEIASMGYFSFGKRFGIISELGLKRGKDESVNSPTGGRVLFCTSIQTKVFSVYGLINNQKSPIPNLFLSAGYALDIGISCADMELSDYRFLTLIYGNWNQTKNHSKNDGNVSYRNNSKCVDFS